MSCIVIDIGNTSTSVGLYDSGKVSCISAIRGGIADVSAADLALKKAGGADAGGAIIASVVPRDTPEWVWLLKRVYDIDAEILTFNTPMPIGIDYPKPETIGADRLANACGAFVRYGSPAIIADFGTALTFDILDRRNKYYGGVIAPGLPLMTDYLHEKTALLPKVELGGKIQPIGRSTEEAMKIGALIGHRGMVRESVSYLSKSRGSGEIRLCATGGYARWALDGAGLPFHIDQDLTLFGQGTVFDCITNGRHGPRKKDLRSQRRAKTHIGKK